MAEPGDPGGRHRPIAVGAVADLVLLHTPLAEALLDTAAVRATVLNGALLDG